MTDPRAHLMQALASHYRIERELGAGGMATVYLAHDLKHDRPVALKVLRPELAAILGGERFLKEIRLTANLQHPHILGLHDSGEADGVIYYVMPFVEGESLRDRLTREKQLPIDEAVRIATEVASALDYAHRHGVVHRDIKPENILLHDGSALVADFGIALAVSQVGGGTRLTETGMSLGTPHYMAPEQAMGEREITARADVYALGCVLYEMLSGEPPFTGLTAQAIVARVLTEEPRSLSLQRHTVPPQIEDAVLTALEKLPADRFASAAQFAQALGRQGAAVPMTSTRTRNVAQRVVIGGPRRATRYILASTALGVAGIAFGTWGWLRARAANNVPAHWQYITLGDSANLILTTPSFALSPDGSQLVYRDNRLNGLLFLKRWETLKAAPIAGTQRAQNPVFSPDGQWVAYVADGRLKKIRVAGSEPVTLADSVAGGFSGATWLDDGTLVYVHTGLTAMRRVKETGGTSTALPIDSINQGGGIGTLVALPHARGVLFQYCVSSCITQGIHVLDLRTGKQKLLLNDATQAWYLPGGLLLYVRRDGTALVAPFDLESLEITGAATPVLESVAPSTRGGFAPLAVSQAGTLMYVPGLGTGSEQLVVRVNRAGAAAPLDTSWHDQFNSLALSHDGSRLAVGIGNGGTLNIWVRGVDAGPATRLTFGNQDRRPVWSPDGREVAFVRDSLGSGSFASGGAINAIYARAADGSGHDRLLARLDRQVQEVEWSRDGHWLLARTDNGAKGAGDIVGVRTSGDTTPVPLLDSPFTEAHPALSPDGRWIAYTSDESGTNEVYVRPFPATGSGKWQISNGGGVEPRWSANGREIFYLDQSTQMVAAQVRLSPSFSLLGTKALFDASRLTIDFYHQCYDVSPDGATFYFLSPRLAQHQIQIVWVDHWFSDLKAKLGR